MESSKIVNEEVLNVLLAWDTEFYNYLKETLEYK